MNISTPEAHRRFELREVSRGLAAKGILRAAAFIGLFLLLAPFAMVEYVFCFSHHGRRAAFQRWMHWVARCSCPILGIKLCVIGERPPSHARIHVRGSGLLHQLVMTAASPNLRKTVGPIQVVRIEYDKSLKLLARGINSRGAGITELLNGNGGEVAVLFGAPVSEPNTPAEDLSDRHEALADIVGILRHYA